jgi:diacylglycerol kinase family enzyme
VARIVTVLYNPRAGTARTDDETARIGTLFQEAGLTARLVPVASPEETVAATRAAIGCRVDAVVAAGGDGTVNSAASALVDAPVPLGVLPLGTLNHFARDLGLPLDCAEAIAVIAAGRTARVDVGEINGLIFLNNSSIGIYPDIVMEREALRERGYRKATAFAIATMRVARGYPGVTLSIDDGSATRVARTPFLFVGNNEYGAAGIQIGARRRLDAGLLYAYFAQQMQPGGVFRLAMQALAGRTRDGSRSPLEVVASSALRVDTPRRHVRVALDGEVAELMPPLLYRARPRALTVLVPAA